MYFNKIVLPAMEYVEDFVDFLIDAELNDLPVLKRACERYLCGELNTVSPSTDAFLWHVPSARFRRLFAEEGPAHITSTRPAIHLDRLPAACHEEHDAV